MGLLYLYHKEKKITEKCEKTRMAIGLLNDSAIRIVNLLARLIFVVASVEFLYSKILFNMVFSNCKIHPQNYCLLVIFMKLWCKFFTVKKVFFVCLFFSDDTKLYVFSHSSIFSKCFILVRVMLGPGNTSPNTYQHLGVL